MTSKNGVTRSAEHFVCMCPRKELHKNPDGKIFILKSNGHTNRFSHLKACTSHGDVNHLQHTRVKNFNLKQSSVGDHFQPIMSITEKEKELIAWVKLAADKGLPIETASNLSFRAFRQIKKEHNISEKLFRNTFLVIVELIEEDIEKEMQESGHSSILHNRWAKNSTHCVALIGTRMQRIKTHVKGKAECKEIPTHMLLACLPLGDYREEGMLVRIFFA